jgi:predicted O-methyltransferase YrrM
MDEVARLQAALDLATTEKDALQHKLCQSIDEVGRLRSELGLVTSERDRLLFGWPPGHFYSPIPDIDEIRRKEDTIFRIPSDIMGVNLNVARQLRLFDILKKYYSEQPFRDDKQEDIRFYFQNPNFSYGEAIIFYSMIRHLQPKRIIEVGSGYSSCVMLDTNELFLDNSVSCTCIEPHPQLLQSLLREGDTEKLNIVQQNLQDIDISIFSELSEGDILFIDSTHVSKIHSDVNFIFSDILPCLRNGVYIHFHDIFYPFEYPKEWIYQGRAWNEVYLLRAFLQYNTNFEIQFFNSYLWHLHRDIFINDMPLCSNNPGTSIWLKKTQTR